MASTPEWQELLVDFVPAHVAETLIRRRSVADDTQMSAPEYSEEKDYFLEDWEMELEPRTTRNLATSDLARHAMPHLRARAHMLSGDT
eukprot:2009528-Pyramimonas_sp.AAC.2